MKRKDTQRKQKHSHQEPDTTDKIEKLASAAITVYRTLKPIAKTRKK